MDKTGKKVVTFDSQTMTLKAHRQLERKGYRNKVLKLSPSKTPRGCTHGLELDENRISDALDVLDAAGIKYTSIIRL